MSGLHPLFSKRWTEVADSLIPRAVRALEEQSKATKQLVKQTETLLTELEELRAFKARVERDAHNWEEVLEDLLYAAEQTDMLLSDEDLMDVVDDLQAYFRDLRKPLT